MKLKTNTMLLAIAAFLIAGGWIYWDVSQNNRSQQTAEKTQKANLFDFKEDDVVRLTVSPQAGTTLTFERTQERFPNTWKMVKPKQVVADEAAIAFLLDQLASGKIQNTVTVDKVQWVDFGIAPDSPQTTVTLTNGNSHTLLLGGETFDKQNLYAVVNPPTPLPNSVTVSIVSTTLTDAIQRSLDEWEYDPKDLPSVPPALPKKQQESDQNNAEPNNSKQPSSLPSD